MRTFVHIRNNTFYSTRVEFWPVVPSANLGEPCFNQTSEKTLIVAWVSGLPKGRGDFFGLPFSLLFPFPPETPDTQATLIVKRNSPQCVECVASCVEKRRNILQLHDWLLHRKPSLSLWNLKIKSGVIKTVNVKWQRISGRALNLIACKMCAFPLRFLLAVSRFG